MGTTVKYYDGSTKINRNVYCSVIDQDIDPVDLQQCADAVMRLRGEYLLKQKNTKRSISTFSQMAKHDIL